MHSVTVLAQVPTSMIFGPFSSGTILAAFLAGACFRWPSILPAAHLVLPDPVARETAPAVLEEPEAAAAPPCTCVCDCRSRLEGSDPTAGPAPCTIDVALRASAELRLSLAGVTIAVLAFTCGCCCRRGPSRERRPTTALARLEGYRA